MVKSKTGVQKFNIQAFIFALCVFLSMQPYFLWHKQGVFFLGHLLVWYVPMTVAVISFMNRNRSPRLTPFLVFFSFIIILSSIVHNTGFQAVFLLCLALVPFLKQDFSQVSFGYFKTILASVFIVSMASWLCVIVGVNLPSYTLEPLNEIKKYTYQAYPMLVMSDSLSLDMLFDRFRFCGPFDEPGVVGTISSLVLIIERYNLKKWQNIVFFVAGCLAMSMAFFAMTAIFGILLLFRHNKKILLFGVLLLPVIYTATKDNEVIDSLVYSRFEYDSQTKSFKGNTRQDEELEKFVSDHFWTNDILFGNSNLLVKRGYDGEFNFYIGILIHGAVIILLYIVFFVAYAFSMKMSRQSQVLFLLLFSLTLYQRPQIFDLVFIYLFSSFIILNSRMTMPVKTKIEKQLA